ncbi:uncharacterized protein LOC142343239 [Convolutriloba macropyga]|uniref:uncharacterized protein LOC142343239 n=1 Tax=Convolutriloba macropyga TaxID=536237 RepID=UPI003F51C1BA
MKTETITQSISVILSAASIALQLYVSCHRQPTSEAMGDILSANPPQIQFTSLAQLEQQQQQHNSTSANGLDMFDGSNKDSGSTQKISIVTMDEHSEAMQDQNGRDNLTLGVGSGGGVSDGESVEVGRQQSAIPRLMLIITIMTCLLCSLMVLDIFLWADLYYRENFSCWHYLLSQISFVGFFFKFWMLPAALLFGCRSLRQEVNLCTCMSSLFNKFKAIGTLFTPTANSSSDGKHEPFSNSED